MKKYSINCLKLSVYLLGCVVSLPLMAVDGYKDLKFGMSEKQIIQNNICTFKKHTSNQLGISSYGCRDFKFGGSTVDAAVFFIDGKFLRLGIVAPLDMAEGLNNGLLSKYGQPSSASNREEFEAIDKFPNRSAFIAYDNDTVIFKLRSGENNMQHALLIYTSKRYDALLVQKQQESINNDL